MNPMLDTMRRVLIVAAHPDDEVLGCGATAARLVAAGADVQPLILATGAVSRSDGSPGDVGLLQCAAAAAAAVIGMRPPLFDNFPDNAMDTLALLQIVKAIEKTIVAFQPDTILTHHGSDLNVDHRLACEAVLTAARPLPGACVKTVLAYETVSSTEWTAPHHQMFRPNFFVDVSDFLTHKLHALDHYSAEMRTSPHPRSDENIISLANLRGRTVGFYAAEAFELVRTVIGRN
jgi:LmbE family N-acetylglucosaminyl deacetylase